LAFRLKQNGYEKVYALKGGWQAWVNAEYPVQEKSNEASKEKK
jgi:3-mercaptopyruvate sulfurtransferase SseA